VVGFPSYGVEMRGGAAYYSCIISSKEIGSPIISNPSSLIIMSKPAYDKFIDKLSPYGLLLVNSSMVQSENLDFISKKNIKLIEIPATWLAETKFKASFVTNMLMLGAYLGIKNLIKPEVVFLSLGKLLKRKELYEINKEALIEGIKYVSK
jgi:Pyruvate/2-oxoacid:ferredoxin oxidoreductase gamma subunit